MNHTTLPTFLPGHFTLHPGTRHHYHALHRFHYRPKPPATFAKIWTISYTPPRHQLRTKNAELRTKPIAVLVLSYPTVHSHQRDRALPLPTNPKTKLRYINQNIRTISRVIVHPRFRSLGLAAALVRHACQSNPTRYTEAFAKMARVHPFFQKGGMTRIISPDPTKPDYFFAF